MELLAKEYYEPTRHYWYQADLEADHEFGKIFNSKMDIGPIVETIKKDMANELAEEGMYWYFGKEADQILMMVRYKGGNFEVQVNIKDFDFALNLDQIIEWKDSISKALKKK